MIGAGASDSNAVGPYDQFAKDADTTMIIVTAEYRGERGGCLVGFHTQCSIEPPRHAVWLSRANHTCRVALQATHLGVHFLDRRDQTLARLFGEETGDEIDKFEHCRADGRNFGVPMLTDVTNRMVARRTTYMEDGSDHVCFIVEPVLVERMAGLEPMRLSHVSHLEPGHAADDPARDT